MPERGQAVATARPCAGSERRHRAPVYPATVRRAGNVRALSAGKPWRTSKRRHHRQAVPPFDRATVRRVPEAGNRPAPVASRPRLSAIPATVRPWRTPERGQAVATVRPWQPIRQRKPRRLSAIPANIGTPPPSNAAPPVSLSARIPATSNAGKPWQPWRTSNAAGSVRRGDRVPPVSDSGQCRRILPAVCATVGRPPCFRGNRSRLARLISPETRRKRPPLRPPVPDGFAPVPPCRALARPFNAACNAGKDSGQCQRTPPPSNAATVPEASAVRKPSAPDLPPSPETRRKRPPLRPPPVPCPRPSEMRRALCKPFSTVCNAGKDSSQCQRTPRRQSIRRPFDRPATASENGDFCALVFYGKTRNAQFARAKPSRRGGLWYFHAPKHARAGFAAPSVSGSEVATIGKPWRPCAAGSVRQFRPMSAGNRSTVCRLSVYPASRGEHLTRATYPATVRQSPPSETGKDSGNIERGNRSRPVSGSEVATIGKPWRPCAAGSVRQSRAGFRPMSPDSSRRVRNRWPSALLSRQPFASRPPNFAGNVA